jgi:hypothetical protein
MERAMDNWMLLPTIPFAVVCLLVHGLRVLTHELVNLGLLEHTKNYISKCCEIKEMSQMYFEFSNSGRRGCRHKRFKRLGSGIVGDNEQIIDIC